MKVIQVEESEVETTWLRVQLDEAKKSRYQSNEEVTQLAMSLVEAGKAYSELEENLTVVKHHLMEASNESMKSFKQNIDVHQVMLQSSQKAYQLGFVECKKKLGKCLPNSNISLLSSSSSSSSLVGAKGDKEWGDVKLHPLWFSFSFCNKVVQSL